MFILAIDILLSLVLAGNTATVTVTLDSATPQTFAGAQAFLQTPADWTLSGGSSPEYNWWSTTLLANPGGKVVLALYGDPLNTPIAPMTAYTLTFDAPSPGCVSFGSYTFTDYCIPSRVASVGGVDITGVIVSSCEANCPGDRNGDGVVDISDLSLWLVAYGCGANLDDGARLLSHFGSVCR